MGRRQGVNVVIHVAPYRLCKVNHCCR